MRFQLDRYKPGRIMMRLPTVVLLVSSVSAISILAICQTVDSGTSVSGNASSAQGLVLGAGDQLTVAAPDIEELDRRRLKVQADGSVSVPLVGAIKAAGLTADEFQAKLNDALRSQFRNPHVSFTQIDVKSKPITVLGAVNNPGVIQADGRRHLIEAISSAGGLRNDAGPTLTISRKTTGSDFPASLKPTLSGKYLVVTIPIESVMEGTNPTANVLMQPGDVITVPKGQLVYVVGDVKRSGGFLLGESNDLTILQAISLAQGPTETADTKHAKILRTDPTGAKTEQEINLKDLLAGKKDLEDQRLKANDILFIPSSTAKKVTNRAIAAMIDGGTGVAIYRH